MFTNALPELAQHEYAIDYATGNFTLKIIDYAQFDISETFTIRRKYNSRTGKWQFNLKSNEPKLTLGTLREIFLIYEGTNLIAVKDELGRTTRYEYDGQFLRRVVYPDGSQIKYFYDDEKHLTACIGRAGKDIFRNEYDEFGRLTKIVDDTGTRNFLYDVKNRLTIESGRDAITYQWTRNKLIERIIYADGTKECFFYDDECRLNYAVSRDGDEHFWRYIEGRLVREILPNGLIKKLEYDERGNIVRQMDSEGREEIFVYSTKNLLIEKRVRLNVKDWHREIWAHDMAGRVTRHEINGRATTYAYDEEAPVPALMKTPCGYKFSYFYDKAYRLLTLRTAVGEFHFAYTPMNGVVAAQSEIFAQIESPEKFDGDADIKLFDAGGRLIEARKRIDQKFKLTRWKYDLNDNCIERRDWLDLQTANSATGRVKIIRYAYDEQNRLSSKMEGDNVTKYFYDCLNRLIKVRQ